MASHQSLASVALDDDTTAVPAEHAASPALQEAEALAAKIIGAFLKNETVPNSKEVRTVVVQKPSIMDLIKTGYELVKDLVALSADERKQCLIAALAIVARDESDLIDAKTLAVMDTMIEHDVVADIFDVVVDASKGAVNLDHLKQTVVDAEAVTVSCWKCWGH